MSVWDLHTSVFCACYFACCIQPVSVQDIWYSLNKKEVDAAMAGHAVSVSLGSVLRKPSTAATATRASSTSRSPRVVARRPASATNNADVLQALQAGCDPHAATDADMVRALEELMDQEKQNDDHVNHETASLPASGDAGNPCTLSALPADAETCPVTQPQQTLDGPGGAALGPSATSGISGTVPDTDYQHELQSQSQQHPTCTTSPQEPVNVHEQEFDHFCFGAGVGGSGHTNYY